MTEYRMVYDSGSTLLKCAIADESGKIIALKSWRSELIQSEDGFHREWNYKNYWENLIELTKVTINSAKINPKDLKYITATSMRPSCVFADEDNNAVYIGASFELRGIDYAQKIEEEFLERTGKSFYESSGHFPSLLFIPARFKYFKEEKKEEERYHKISQYLPLDSWILVKFGGEIHTNITSAGESGFFDIETKLWHPAWEDLLDLPDYFFPWPVLPGEIIGTVSELYQKELNLNSEVQLVAGMSDTQAALLGCQCVEIGSIGAVLGTTSPVQAVIKNPYFDPDEKTWSGLFACKDLFNHYYLEISTGITGRLLEWAANLFYGEEGSTSIQRFQKLDEDFEHYDQFELQATSDQIRKTSVYSLLGPSPLASTQMGITPGLFHFESPGGVEEVFHNKNAFIAAVFDNIQFAITRNIEYLIKIAKIQNPFYAFMGGITRNLTLLQRFSDLLQSSIISSTNYESSIQGMLVLCDVAANRIRSLDDLKSRNQKLKLINKINPRNLMIQKLVNRYNSWLKIYQQYNK
jgi:sugar (pentulose or hexulose) kinase